MSNPWVNDPIKNAMKLYNINPNVIFTYACYLDPNSNHRFYFDSEDNTRQRVTKILYHVSHQITKQIFFIDILPIVLCCPLSTKQHKLRFGCYVC